MGYLLKGCEILLLISYKNVTREAFVPFKTVNLVNPVTLRHQNSHLLIYKKAVCHNLERGGSVIISFSLHMS